MKLNDIEEFIMKFSYKKLWKLLIDRDIIVVQLSRQKSKHFIMN